ncbi:MAG: CoB--CoM heterodisulfide reductase iron-sulfur subunit A family protein [Thermoplasmata archaeon]|nr:MAG: CoB--CoM heterodisulfide reductase iron-sulfur subunit A family protein [Thermoplasmata archaeon]
MSRIGVFICHCGVNIAGIVDVEKLVEYAKTLDDVIVSKHYTYLCSDTGATLIKDSIKENNLDAVVIAACSPRMHEHTFRKVAEEGGINPYRLEIANIREQCSWVHDDKEKATKKAKLLVKSAVARAKLLEPLEKGESNVIQKALVIGGGIAGIQASLDLANQGFNVILVEKEPTIGGRMAQLDKTFPTLDCSSCILTPKMMDVAHHPNIELLTYSEVVGVDGSVGSYKVKIKKKPRYVNEEKCTGCGLCADACRLKERIPDEFDLGLKKRGAIYLPFPQAVPNVYIIDASHCLFLTKGKCGDKPACKEACKQEAIDFSQQEQEMEREVGIIIVATGYELMDASNLAEYGYEKSEDVITTLEVERIINASGPTKGNFIRPSTGEKPKSVTFILCAGSRDEKHFQWCCRIGCMSALKQAYLLKEKLGDELEINICYTDIRSFGKGYEEFYRKLRGMNINFFRGRPSEVRVKNSLQIDVFDTTTNKLFEIITDIVVLVPPILPRRDAEELARLLRISRSSEGFYMEAHPKLKPIDSTADGIFIAGCCQSPKDIQDTVAQASGAAARAATIISKERLEIEPIIAVVDEDVCSGCGVCVSTCWYNAIEMETEGKKGKEIRKAVVNETLCKGCGTCVAACPSGAMQLLNYKDKQIRAMVNGCLL